MKKSPVRRVEMSSVADYIAAEKRKARVLGKERKYFRWGPEDWLVLTQWVWVLTCNIFTGKNGIDLKEGDTIMGVKHYIKK